MLNQSFAVLHRTKIVMHLLFIIKVALNSDIHAENCEYIESFNVH